MNSDETHKAAIVSANCTYVRSRSLAAPDRAQPALGPSRANPTAPAPAVKGAASERETQESRSGAEAGAGTAGMPEASGSARPGEHRTLERDEPAAARDSPEPAAARQRVVLHVDIDAFFAAIEQQRDPRLAGRPVIVGAGVIASCSYEARRVRAQGRHAALRGAPALPGRGDPRGPRADLPLLRREHLRSVPHAFARGRDLPRRGLLRPLAAPSACTAIRAPPPRGSSATSSPPPDSR